MNITPEIKSAIFHQYHGQYVNSNKGQCRLRDADFVDSLEWIELKSLAEISDEDIIWVYDTTHNLHEERKLRPERVLSITPSLKDMKETLNNGYAHYTGGWLCNVWVFQYLLKRGYDLPQLSLGYKTLQQVGLAKYKNEINKN